MEKPVGCMNAIRDILKLNDKNYSIFEQDFHLIDLALEKHAIEIPEKLVAPFYNHIAMLMIRLKGGNLTESLLEPALEGEISPECRRIADEILLPVFEKYQAPYNETEVFLLAIYLQSAANSEF